MDIKGLNILETFEDLKDYFSPRIIAEVNDVYVKVAKIKGDKVPWHNHKDEDELFYIIEGSLIAVYKSSGNVFKDPGCYASEAENLRVRFSL